MQAALNQTRLNTFFALPTVLRRELRKAMSASLSDLAFKAAVEPALHPMAACELHLPATIGDYTDFYVGIHHATHVGQLFRPDNPLLPNYKYVPIGYHGRASSIRPSGVPVIRPAGQTKGPQDSEPSFGPTRRLDYELELGLWIGPFLAKNFHSTISPWVITPEALAPFRAAQPARDAADPKPLPYLWDEQDQAGGALALDLSVTLSTTRMRDQGLPDFALSHGPSSNMYWTPAQIVAHHASNGCNLQPGDLLGTGTISGPDRSAYGSLLEISRGGAEPMTLPSGEQRTFLEDGDEVVLTATAQREGFVPIGFGECRARILPAKG